ncbi:MAG: hypothetical protein EXX96DRAFT_651628 [Benjaminiella poitrasii]|nr:MAG: hypothetical protein EXX96DRAFT_651628 [Benjaminiella poitrasii]
MKKNRINSLTSDEPKDVYKVVNNVSTEVEKALLDQSVISSPNTSPIKLTSKGAVQLSSSASLKNATTNAILNLKVNPFFHDKRKWDDSFTVAEKKELTGNIVKAAKDNDGETNVTLQKEDFASQEDQDDSQQDSSDDGSKKPGRKPIPNEESLSDLDHDPKVKRKAQNRAAQRAFRERKERYVKELEAKLKQVQDARLFVTAQLVQENQQLRAIIQRLEAENCALKGIPIPSYQQPVPATLDHNSTSSNFTAIAPLLPNIPGHSVSLPFYLSSTTTSSILQPTITSINQMMLLANTPSQQYPIPHALSTALQDTMGISSPFDTFNTLTTSPSSPAKPMPKKVSVKKLASKTSSNTQPLEYTFSISTPASLRPTTGGSTTTLTKHQSEPIELVQLHPPNNAQQQKTDSNSKENKETLSSLTEEATLSTTPNSALDSPSPHIVSRVDDEVGPQSDRNAQEAHDTTSSTNKRDNHLAAFIFDKDDASSAVSDMTTTTQQLQSKKMQQLELDMFGCHIDTEGQLFCEQLHKEVCGNDDAFHQLLSEPLFDQMGKLNLSIGPYSTTTATTPLIDKEEQSKTDKSSSPKEQLSVLENEKKGDSSMIDHLLFNDMRVLEEMSNIITTTAQKEKKQRQGTDSGDKKNNLVQKRLLTCTEIWFVLNQHNKFENFTTDELCQAVKKLAKSSINGPVIEEADLYLIMSRMDQGSL